MNSHALGVLEFPRLLVHVAGYAASASGAAAVMGLQPHTDRDWIEAEHARVTAMRSLIESELGWLREPIPDIGGALERLRLEGLSWSAQELLQAATLLRSSRRMRAALRDPRRPVITVAFLAHLVDELVDLESQEGAITRAIADDGTVRDDASPALRRVRHALRETEGQLVRILEREMAKIEPHHQVSDLSVTIRNGRWVIPMRREARGFVGGIVHDSSATGATIFVEPPAAVEFGNHVRELEIEEQREVERVLRGLTDELRPDREAIQQARDALIQLDSLSARARYAIGAQCASLALGSPCEGFRIVDGRHPLLLAGETEVVPFDLTLHSSERTMLVSGPNTGGKTVLLKAIGLLSMMAQAGIPAPLGETSRLAVFDDVFADVGDEQSIEASLSTFSAHLRNLGEILRCASSSSLVLIDELGSGTDPAEGAALGGAILETLTKRGTLTVATTHLGQLKLLATDVVGVVNASLQFDAEHLAPTYRLLKGVPGRSYGLSIARRLQIDEAVIEMAEARLPRGERDMAVLLADVEAREARLAVREQQMAISEEKLRARLATVSDRELKVRESARESERKARQDARRYLLEARGQVERAISDVRREGPDDAAALEEAARLARRSVEEAAAAQAAALKEVGLRAERDRARVQSKSDGRPAGSPRGGGIGSAPLAEGDHVAVAALEGKRGRIVSIRGGDARVLVGSLTVTVPLTDLVRSATPLPLEHVALTGELPEAMLVREVDVRGLRVDEVDETVLQALDSAVRNDLRELRIIHGKGTGALRARVGEMLGKDTRVTGFRLGAWNEGGAGVTVVGLA